MKRKRTITHHAILNLFEPDISEINKSNDNYVNGIIQENYHVQIITTTFDTECGYKNTFKTEI